MMMKFSRVPMLVLSCLTLCAAQMAVAQDSSATVRKDSAVVAANPAAPAVRTLHPGDGLRVRIFREPELSGEYMIDERSMVVLPKLGPVSVHDVPADSIRPMLLDMYGKYLSGDAIEIMAFRRVAITGEVLKPGLYPIDPTLSVAEAIIQAGGVGPMGKRNDVQLRVYGTGKTKRVEAERLVWDTPAGGTQQLYVPRRSWLVRNIIPTITLSLSIANMAFWLVRLANP